MAVTKTKKNSGPAKALTPRQVIDGTSELIRRHASQISEYCDTVQIIATTLHSDGSTSRFAHGSGNMYGRIKTLEVWLSQQAS